MSKNNLCVQIGSFSSKSPSARSVDFSKGLFRAQSIDPIDQVIELKQKAHKAFMQVIQMQALHQQQMQMVKKQHQQQLADYRTKQQLLLKKIKSLQEDIKINTKRNFQAYNFSFTIDNIDDIQYKQQSNCIDDSSIVNLRQLLNNRDYADKFRNFKNQVKRQIKNLIEGKASDQKNLIDKLFTVFSQINFENHSLKQQNQELNKKLIKLQSQIKTLKIQNQSTQKEAKFLSDHIKRIHSDKISLEKKLSDVEKVKKFLQDTLKNSRKNNNDDIICSGTLTVQNYHNPKLRKTSYATLQSNLQSSRQTQQSFKGTLSTKLPRICSQTAFNTQQPSNSTLNLVKNFRKKQNYRKVE